MISERSLAKTPPTTSTVVTPVAPQIDLVVVTTFTPTTVTLDTNPEISTDEQTVLTVVIDNES